jgi:hypothetical protein
VLHFTGTFVASEIPSIPGPRNSGHPKAAPKQFNAVKTTAHPIRQNIIGT